MSPHGKALDVLILGGGIIGLAIARELAGLGLDVQLIERGQLGAGASAAAAGMLAPLSEVPRSGPFFELCRRAREGWPAFVAELDSETGDRIELDTSGALALASDEPSRAYLARLVAAAGSLGEPTEEIAIEDARQRVPDLSPLVERVVHFPGEHRVDNVAACRALAKAARARGARLRSDFEVLSVELGSSSVVLHGPGASFEAAVLVLAAGAWSGRIAGLPPLPIVPVRGQMLRLSGLRWPWQGCLLAQNGYAVRRGETDLLVGATEEWETGFNAEVTPEGQEQLRQFLRQFLPALGDRPAVSAWAGLRPATSDHLPLLGWLVPERVAVTSGHFRNGILLAPWTAAQTGRLLRGQASAFPSEYSPTRFV